MHKPLSYMHLMKHASLFCATVNHFLNYSFSSFVFYEFSQLQFSSNICVPKTPVLLLTPDSPGCVRAWCQPQSQPSLVLFGDFKRSLQKAASLWVHRVCFGIDKRTSHRLSPMWSHEKKKFKDKQKNRCAPVLPSYSAVHRVSSSLNASSGLVKVKHRYSGKNALTCTFFTEIFVVLEKGWYLDLGNLKKKKKQKTD